MPKYVENAIRGDVDMIIGASTCQYWFGKDMKAQITISKEDFFLTETATGKATHIGRTIEEARLKLKQLGKENNFENF